MLSTSTVTKALAAAAVLLLVGGCTTPSFSDDDYRRKAAHTADTVASLVSAAALAADTARRGSATEAYLDVVVGDAEEQAGAVQATFESVDPPDGDADALRAKLERILDDATGALTDLRIAVRRGHHAELGPIAKPLPGIAQRLTDFSEANQ